MFTVDDLIRQMEVSGRSFTRRTARSWWSVGVLPPPQRGKGCGRGAGTTAGFWVDKGVLLRAQIAHDLLEHRATLGRTAAGLWLLGFPVPFEVVHRTIQGQVLGYYRRLGYETGMDLEDRDSLEDQISDVSQRVRRRDARVRGGSSQDREGDALGWLTCDLLSMLFGVHGEETLSQDRQVSSKEMADGILENVQFLASIPGRLDSSWELPVINADDVEELVIWVREVASVSRQREAIAVARQHDWVRARRIVLLALGLLKRADAAIPREEERILPPFFARLAAAWSCLLFPVLLAIALDGKRRQWLAAKLFELSATVRAGPRPRGPTGERGQVSNALASRRRSRHEVASKS